MYSDWVILQVFQSKDLRQAVVDFKRVFQTTVLIMWTLRRIIGYKRCKKETLVVLENQHVHIIVTNVIFADY